MVGSRTAVISGHELRSITIAGSSLPIRLRPGSAKASGICDRRRTRAMISIIVFDSVVCGDAGPGSDNDVLIDVDRASAFDLWGYRAQQSR